MTRAKIAHIFRLWRPLGIAILCVVSSLPPAYADEDNSRLPRFVSVKSDEVNLRTGPGIRYPVRWVYRKQWLPVEIIEEFEHWRKIRDLDGESGWVHKSLLSSRRSGMISVPLATLRTDPDPTAPPVLRIQKSVIIAIVNCTKDWCRLQHGDTKGWLPKKEFWGTYDEEIFE